MVRVVLWIALAVAAVGLCGSAWIIVASLQPELGASMVLMGLGMFATPTIFCALIAVGIVLVDGASLSRWEQRLAWLAALMAVAIVAVGFVLV